MAPPRGFFAFLWVCSSGLRRYVLGMTLLTATIGAFEALLFSMLGRIVDWLAKVHPEKLLVDYKGQLLLLGGILLASPLAVMFQTMLKHQT